MNAMSKPVAAEKGPASAGHAERSEASAVFYRKETKSRSLASLGMTWSRVLSAAF
jgi:hypothetical protein